MIEVLVTVVLFSLLFGACLTVLLSGSDSWQSNDVKLQLQQELRKGMDWMKNDLLQGGVSTITDVPADGNWYTTITFKTSNGVSGGNISWPSDTTQYLLSGNQLQRKVGSTTQSIAQSIRSLQVRRQASNSSLVEVLMSAQKNSLRGTIITDSLDFQVQFRN